jgi:hypothetical protein
MSEETPVERLLARLVERDEEREVREENRDQVLKRIESTLAELKGEVTRTKNDLRDITTELRRQDSQLQLFDGRIHGNYVGIASRLDAVDEDLKHGNAVIGNVEVAVVDLTRATRTLHGRMIEESNIVGGRLKKSEERLNVAEREIGALDQRVGQAESSVRALEGRVASSDPTSVESVMGTGGAR